MAEHVNPCSNCGCKRVSVRRRKGIAGRVTKTPYYRETIECLNCGITVIAKVPGKGIALWNKAAFADQACQLVTEANNSLFGSQTYFHSLKGGPFDRLHLARAIEDLKARARQA